MNHKMQMTTFMPVFYLCIRQFRGVQLGCELLDHLVLDLGRGLLPLLPALVALQQSGLVGEQGNILPIFARNTFYN